MGNSPSRSESNPLLYNIGNSPSRSEDDLGVVDESLELRRLYHGLARSLEGGTATRPGLPVELVIPIIRLAECVLRRRVFAEQSCNVRADSAQTSRIIWFCTPPLKRSFFERGLDMQLFTTSRDQGWVSDPDAGSWSWFEIAVVSTSGTKRRESDGSELVWTSHYNPIASDDWNTLEGQIFDKNHEIWQHIADGDILEVRACAKYGSWENNTREGSLDFVESFEPTISPRSRLR